ncbi:DUF302 domain-containing protein [Thiosocius teredinicola]|uniref:DUF302 domain-containing protein n=1 Tax=Thiosocius teredinicola TaxID=1973002 RepID=UPI000990EE8A
MRKLLPALCLLMVSLGVHAAAPGVMRFDAKAPLSKTYPAVYAALEEARFWVVFEADVGGGMAGLAERWGDDYNRNALDAIKSIVVCNAWYANQVSNADPDLLALCPIRVSLVEKDGITRVLFARPTLVAEGSPAIGIVKEIEDVIAKALQSAVSKAEKD